MNTPAGFSTVTPYIFVDRADQFIEFLKSAFDVVEIGRSLRSDSKVANAQIKIGNTIVMVSESDFKYKAMPASFYIYVDNADTSMNLALKSGAVLEMSVQDMPYGDRQGGVTDLWGNIWWISQRLVSAPYF